MKTLLAALLFIAAFGSIFAADVSETLPVGTELTLTAESDGTQPIAFAWSKDGVKVAEGATLKIAALVAADAGTYTVTASNIAGSATSDKYTLIVAVPPSKPTIRVTSKKPSDVTVSVQPGMKVVVQR